MTKSAIRIRMLSNFYITIINIKHLWLKSHGLDICIYNLIWEGGIVRGASKRSPKKIRKCPTTKILKEIDRDKWRSILRRYLGVQMVSSEQVYKGICRYLFHHLALPWLNNKGRIDSSSKSGNWNRKISICPSKI